MVCLISAIKNNNDDDKTATTLIKCHPNGLRIWIYFLPLIPYYCLQGRHKDNFVTRWFYSGWSLLWPLTGLFSHVHLHPRSVISHWNRHAVPFWTTGQPAQRFDCNLSARVGRQQRKTADEWNFAKWLNRSWKIFIFFISIFFSSGSIHTEPTVPALSASLDFKMISKF